MDIIKEPSGRIMLKNNNLCTLLLIMSPTFSFSDSSVGRATHFNGVTKQKYLDEKMANSTNPVKWQCRAKLTEVL